MAEKLKTGVTIGLGLGAVAYAASALKDAYSSFGPMWDLQKELRSSDQEVVIKALERIISCLDSDKNSRYAKGHTDKIIDCLMGDIVRILSSQRESKAVHPQINALLNKILLKMTAEPRARDAFAAAGGVPSLMWSVGALWKTRCASPSPGASDTQQLLLALKAVVAVTTVESKEVILPMDVPEGSQGALSLSRFSSLDTFIGTIHDLPIDGVDHISKAVYNMSWLQEGCRNLAKIEECLPILLGQLARNPSGKEKVEQGVRDRVACTLRNLVKRSPGVGARIVEMDKMKGFAMLFSSPHARMDRMYINLLTLLNLMLKNLDKASLAKLAEQIIATNLSDYLGLMMGSEVSKIARRECEEILLTVRSLKGTSDGMKVFGEHFAAALDKYSDAIQAMKAKEAEEEARARRLREQRQQMMMGGGMGMPPGMGMGMPPGMGAPGGDEEGQQQAMMQMAMLQQMMAAQAQQGGGGYP